MAGMGRYLPDSCAPYLQSFATAVVPPDSGRSFSGRLPYPRRGGELSASASPIIQTALYVFDAPHRNGGGRMNRSACVGVALLAVLTGALPAAAEATPSIARPIVDDAPKRRLLVLTDMEADQDDA